MSTGAAKAPTSAELSNILERAVNASPVHIAAKSIENVLMGDGFDKFQRTLPTQFKGEAERFIRRAVIYYQTAEAKTKIHLSTLQSFMLSVLEAAEIGLPLDGKLCYAIVYNNKKKGADGKDYWEHEAQCTPDYKGLIAVAKRGTIRDIYAEIVCEKDDFTFERTESTDTMRHSYKLSGDRGAVIGCYSKVQIPDGSWRFEIVPRGDIDAIRMKSKASDSGPWQHEGSSDWKEMAKKVAIKRILKGFMDDPVLARAIEIDDKAVGYVTDADVPADTRPKVQRLEERLIGPGTSDDAHRQTIPTAERERVHEMPETVQTMVQTAETAKSEESKEIPVDRPKPTYQELFDRIAAATTKDEISDLVFLRLHLTEAEQTDIEAAGRARKEALRAEKSK